MDTERESSAVTKTWYAMMGSWTLRGPALAAAAVLAVSCGASSDGDSSYPAADSSESIPYSYRWSAEPRVDLLSRDAELVRAVEEGGELAFIRGLENSFPGYREALGGPVRHDDPDIMDSVGSVQPLGQAVERTNFRHIADFSATDTAVGATLCTSKLYAHESDNTFEPQLRTTRIELANTTDSPGAPGVPDLNPDGKDAGAFRRPDWNVFGSWKITRFQTLPSSEAPPECTRWWLSQFPTLQTDPGTGRISIPDGFRAPTQPVAVQYPEWIGPADNG